MKKSLLNAVVALLLTISATLMIWQGSFSFGDFRPNDPVQTFVFFSLSLLIFLLTVTLGFMLVRIVLKIWLDQRDGQTGARIRTKLVAGALALTLMPVFFMFLFNYYVMNRTLQKWFTGPSEHVLSDFRNISNALEQQTRGKALAEAQLIASLPDTRELIAHPNEPTPWLDVFCKQRSIGAARILPPDSMQAVARFGTFSTAGENTIYTAAAPILQNGVSIGSVVVEETIPINVMKHLKDIRADEETLTRLDQERKRVRTNMLQLMVLIALFILFFAGWLAQYLARQISKPISALVRAAEEVRQGNLNYRVEEHAIDELAQLVSGFNRMTSDLAANREELEKRRRFTEAILESIPTGIISIDANGGVQRVNKALDEMLPQSGVRQALRLDDMFGREDTAEIRYLMNRARRTGLASQQIDVKTAKRTLHLGVSVAAVERSRNTGFVVVIEDTSELLRAQKTAAWSEVARRVAHEIKNPLTPIAISAERILRMANRTALPLEADQLLRECATTILDESASVKRLVDEFSQFSRLPTAEPVVCDLNDVVTSAMNVFEGRLEGIEAIVDLAPNLPLVNVDPEQFKRVIVNLVDNAGEAMQAAPIRILQVSTKPGVADSVEIVIADSGCGITPDEKDKLFLPYFSTKMRGTGLGLAIVSHILAEHDASIRVEDNEPCGARFTVEVPTFSPDETKVLVTATTLQA